MESEFFPDILVNALNTDFKADVIAAELIEGGVPADRVIVFPLGAFQRPFRKDVETVLEDSSDSRNKKYYLVKTYQEGIYDMLPEGLFHNAMAVKNPTSETEVAEAIERHRVEEKDARRFFLPFEAAIHQLRVQMTLYENRLDKKGHYNDLVDIFLKHWKIFKYLDVQQSNIFLHVLPLIHELRDDHKAIATVFKMIFRLPISLALQRRPPIRPDQPIFSTLGDTKLGVSFTTGNMMYDEGEDEIHICIGSLDDQQLQDFMPDSKNDTIFRLLCDYLFPAHMEIVLNLELNPSQRITRLKDAGRIKNSMLGVDSYL